MSITADYKETKLTKTSLKLDLLLRLHILPETHRDKQVKGQSRAVNQHKSHIYRKV